MSSQTADGASGSAQESRQEQRRRRRKVGGTRRAVLRAVALTLLGLVWLGISGVGGPLVGRLSEVQENDNANFLPASAESTELAKLSKKFSSASTFPAFVVIERDAGVSDADRAAAQQFARGLPDLTIDVAPAAAGDRTFRLGDYLAPAPTAVVPSEDGKALLLPVLLNGDKAGDSLPDGESVVGQSVKAVRDAAQEQLESTGLKTYVTGPAGFTADLVTAFSGIDGKLLGVSLTAVFIILLLVYRSPLLPLAALMTSAFGLSLAALVVFPLAKSGAITLDGQSQGILSILVIGAATDYALLLVSRYREELHDHASKYVAMRRAWRGSVEPIAASAATVVLGLLCLLLSQLGSTRGLGPVGAIGIGGALLAALTLLPLLLLVPVILLAAVALGVAFAVGAVLVNAVVGLVLVVLVLAAGIYFAVRRRQALRRNDIDGVDGVDGAEGARLPWYARAESGRWLFWPRTPRLDHVHRADSVGGGGIWGRIASLVGNHPRVVWVTTLVVLLGAAVFAPSLKADGVSTSQVFRDRVESVVGQDVLTQHFPGGAGSPALLVVQETDAQQALQVVRSVKGVASAQLTVDPSMAGGTQPPPPKVVDGQVEIEATLSAAADSPAAEETIKRLRSAVDQIGQDVLVGGTTAVNLDVREASRRDLTVIIPAILIVILLVLMVLLRAVVAPLLLIGANVLSFGATIGVSALVFNHVLGFPGGDPQIPLYGFVFLVALGIDYSIFLMTRVREESLEHGTRRGVLVGLAVTGGVITSAGVVLAATFGALSTLPLLFLQQIAFIVAFGVLLDTLVVRSLLVPALTRDIGGRVWWPSRFAADHEDEPAAERSDTITA
ncbi:MMPL family transporter [Angustibacter sp. Root456]|uniref:MMPL family transporter n=1 Tax=Angustibacter sp. Root456 TaxID=1736539 RepID=UPI000AA22FC1|nr:MMPL family transporter [Angustibacter sp. Root456]